MVTEALISVLVGITNGLLSLIPAWKPDTAALTSQAGSVGGWAFAWNGYFPVAVLGVCLVIIFAVKVALTGARAILFVYHQFWGAS